MVTRPVSTQVLTPTAPSPSITARWREARHVLRRHPMMMVGTLMVLTLVSMAIFAPLIAPHSPYETGLGPGLSPPSPGLWMGTDKLGRDLFARIIYGARTTLLVAIPSVALAVGFGVLIGSVAGYMGGRVDQILMRTTDIFLAFPALLLALAIVAMLGPSIPNLLLTIALLYIPSMARIARGPILAAKEMEYVAASRVTGMGNSRILFRHILPNTTSPVIVDATLAVARVILIEASLAYLGLGAPPPNPSWGEMLSSSRQFMTSAPSSALFPGIAIVFAATAFILLGNGLRDWLDPRRR